MRGTNRSGPRRLCQDHSGASAVEYRLILSLVFLALRRAAATPGNFFRADWGGIVVGLRPLGRISAR